MIGFRSADWTFGPGSASHQNGMGIWTLKIARWEEVQSARAPERRHESFRSWLYTEAARPKVAVYSADQPIRAANISNPALSKLDRVTVASMDRRGGVTDFLLSPFVRVREQVPAARFFISLQTLMPERDQSRFHVNVSRAHGCPVSHIGDLWSDDLRRI